MKSHDIFISYSHEDQKIVEGLSAYLEQNGIRCFVAYRDISPSAVWAAKITEAIENCEMMIVVFSEQFNRSSQVDREIQMCIEEGKPILTFKIEDTNYKGAKKYFLANLHYIDAFPNPEECFGELCEKVKNLLKIGGSNPPPPPPSKRQRNIFTSFWIILLMVVNSLAVGIFIISFAEGMEDINSYHFSTISVICNLINLYSTIMILKWLKSGFWLLAVSVLVTIASIFYFNLYDEDGVILTYSSLLSICILFGILHLRRNHKSCWQLMDDSFRWKENKTMYGIFISFLILLLTFCFERTYAFKITNTNNIEELSVSDTNALQRGEWRKDVVKVMKNMKFYDNGNFYNGESRDDNKNVLGVLLSNNGNSYWGEWKKHDFDGIGLYMSDGNAEITNCLGCKYFVGNFESSKKTGTGTCYNETGEIIYYGDFKNDIPVKNYPSREDYSSYKFECIEYSSGEKYIGETKNNKPHGLGIYFWVNGSAWYGSWENGQWSNNGANGLYLSYDGTYQMGYK